MDLRLPEDTFPYDVVRRRGLSEYLLGTTGVNNTEGSTHLLGGLYVAWRIKKKIRRIAKNEITAKCGYVEMEIFSLKRKP